MNFLNNLKYAFQRLFNKRPLSNNDNVTVVFRTAEERIEKLIEVGKNNVVGVIRSTNEALNLQFKEVCRYQNSLVI
jgi:uncharacterized protein YaeQ